eukprot:4354973-Prymnesium_polylepis.1
MGKRGAHRTPHTAPGASTCADCRAHSHAHHVSKYARKQYAVAARRAAQAAARWRGSGGRERRLERLLRVGTLR